MEKQENPPPPYPTNEAGYPPAAYPQQPSYAPPAYPPQAQEGYPPQAQGGFPQQQGYQPVAQGYPEKGGMYPPNVNYGQSPNTVIVSQPATVVINPQQQPIPSATGAICLSCFVFLCCCWPLGCVAFIFAVMASSATSAADARSKINTSNKISIAGVVCGIILLVIIIIAELSGANNDPY